MTIGVGVAPRAARQQVQVQEPDLARRRLLVPDPGRRPLHRVGVAAHRVGAGRGRMGRQVKPLLPWRRVRIVPSAATASSGCTLPTEPFRGAKRSRQDYHQHKP